MTVSRTLRVGVIGFGWMGRLHARSWARLSAHYPGLPLRRLHRQILCADPAIAAPEEPEPTTT